LASEPIDNGPHGLSGPAAPLSSPACRPGGSNAGPRRRPSRPEATGSEELDRPHQEQKRGSAVPFCGTRSLGPHRSELALVARFGWQRTPVVGRGGCRHRKVGDEVRTRGDEEIRRKSEAELIGATGDDGKQRQRRWSSCGGQTGERERGRRLYSGEGLGRARGRLARAASCKDGMCAARQWSWTVVAGMLDCSAI
jgi:hypothetical protein